MSSRPTPQKLNAVMKEVRQSHPLPGECLSSDERSIKDLLTPLSRMDGGEWNRYCKFLDYSLERLIFPSFTKVKDSNDIKRLQQLARERCSWTLYEQAWAVFQDNYNTPYLKDSLAEIYGNLRRDPDRYGPTPSYIRDLLPSRVDFSLSCSKLLNTTYELFSVYMHEPTSDKAQAGNTIPKEKISSFFEDYGISMKSRFGAAILAKYLLSTGDAVLFSNDYFLKLILDKMPREEFCEFIGRVIHSNSLSETQRAPYFNLVLNSLEHSSDGQEVWKNIPKKSRQVLMRWHIWNVMQNHYSLNPRKETLMLQFSRSIVDVIELDYQSVVWLFKDFVILDSWNDMDYSYYFPTKLFYKYYNSEDNSLAVDSNLLYRMLSNDNFDVAVTSAVKLGFVNPQLEMTESFLNMLTGQKPLTKNFGSRFS